MTAEITERRYRSGPDRARNARGSRAATGLRLAGASWDEIAEVMGFATAAQAKSAVMADLASVGSDIEGRSILRDVEGERLNRLLRGVWTKAIDPTNPEHLSAVKTATAVIDRRIRLYGLDAPEEIIVHTPTTAEIDTWITGVIAMQNSTIVEGEVIDEQ